MSKGLKVGLGCAVSLFFCHVLLYQFDWQMAWSLWLGAQGAWIASALLALALGFLLRAVRWQRLITMQGASVDFSESARVFLASYAFNNLMPLRAGDAWRWYTTTQRFDLSGASVLGALFLERVADVIALGFLLVLCALYMGSKSGLGSELIDESGVALLLVGCVVLWLVIRFRHKLPHVITDFLSQFQASLSSTSSPRELSVLLLLSMFGWVCEGLLFHCCMHALGLSIDAVQSGITMAVSTFATLVPSSPGHLGTFDYAVHSCLSFWGVSKSMATAAALFIHIVLWLPITFAGLVAFITLSKASSQPSLNMIEKQYDECQ